MVIEIEDTTNYDFAMDLAEFICTDEHPILTQALPGQLKECNKGHGSDCGTLHSDVKRILSASIRHV